MKPEITTMIFDFDGVIVDSGKDIANAVNHTLCHFGRTELSISEIISYVGQGAKTLIKKSLKEASDKLLEVALPFYKQYYLEHCTEETALYPDVLKTLEYFKEKNMGIVTNKPEEQALRILEVLGALKYFKVVVAPEKVKQMKPHPEGLLMALSHVGGEAEKTIMIGDTYTDIEAGKAAGMLTCGVTYGLGSIKELTDAKPDFLLDRLWQLTEKIS